MSELADDLERLCGEAAANGVKHWKFPLTMILSLAAALRESEEQRRDAERYRFIAADHSLAWEEELDAALDAAIDSASGVG